MSLVPFEEMIGEQWMKSGNPEDLHGAAAFFGNTHPDNDVAAKRGAIARGFFNGLFDESVWQLGRTAVRAKHQLYMEFPGDTYDYRGYTLYGDPALGIWTATPRPLTVEHPADLPPGQQQLAVTVEWQGTPVENALVCASMDTFVYSYAYTDSLGQVALSINVPDTGNLRLVVTGNNLYPYDTLIPVAQTGVADRTRVPVPGVITLSAKPNPCSRTTTVRVLGSSFIVHRSSLSVYDAQGRLAQSGISNPKSEIALDLSGQRAGVYLAILRDQSGRTFAHTRITKLN
jgi:hypothetical protein